MLFNSTSFLFMLLPVTVIAYFLLKNRTYRNAVLLLSSLIFYAWGGGIAFTLLFLAACAVTWLGGLLMEHFGAEGKNTQRRTVYVGVLVLLTANLFVFKYLNFAVRNLELLFGKDFACREVLLPIGISFYTFQLMSYIIDLKRGSIEAQHNPLRFLLYVSFFPQLVVGPIVRYGTVQNELKERSIRLDDVSDGLKRFILGLAKKVIISNNVAFIAETIYAGDPAVYGSAMYWVAALAYTLQIYFDFSGYSDMALGLGRMFGFRFDENFDYPYISRSVTEFWRRWHISLSSWFRDYIYIPLGGNRVSRGRWLLNIMAVWLLTGFWHGAGWNFVLWGVYYGVLLILEKLLLGDVLKKAPAFVSWLYTFIIVNVGWVIFNLTDFAQLGTALKTMFSFAPTNWLDMFASEIMITRAFIYIPLGLICMFPLRKLVKPAKTAAGELLHSGVLAVLLGISIMFVISSSYNPFIYFKF